MLDRCYRRDELAGFEWKAQRRDSCPRPKVLPLDASFPPTGGRYKGLLRPEAGRKAVSHLTL